MLQMLLSHLCQEFTIMYKCCRCRSSVYLRKELKQTELILLLQCYPYSKTMTKLKICFLKKYKTKEPAHVTKRSRKKSVVLFTYDKSQSREKCALQCPLIVSVQHTFLQRLSTVVYNERAYCILNHFRETGIVGKQLISCQ